MRRISLLLGLTAVAGACEDPALLTPPVIADVEVEAENYVADLSFTVEDADDDLDGGTIQVQFAYDPGPLEIGKAIDIVDGTLQIERAYSPCDVGTVVDLEAELVDSAGLHSVVYNDSFELPGDVLREQEPNNLAEPDWHDDFSFEHGRAICGVLSSVGIDSRGIYAGDLDYYHVAPTEAGEWTVTLRGSVPSARFDVWSTNAGPWQAHYAHGQVVAFDIETNPDRSFYLGVMADAGPTGQYSITFE